MGDNADMHKTTKNYAQNAELLALEKKLHDYLLDECFPYVVEMECGKCEKACETVAQAIRKESEK